MSGGPDPYPTSAVCYITAVSGRTTWQGSGVIIGPHTVLTAAHVLWDGAQPMTNVRVYPGYAAGGTLIQGALQIHYNAVEATAHTLNKAGSALDFAVIDFAADLSAYGRFSLQAGNAGGWVHATGYPGASHGTQVDQVGTVAADPLAAVLDYGSLVVQSGSSGGPVWINAGDFAHPDPTVIGVVSTAGWATQLTLADLAQIQAWQAADAFLWARPDASNVHAVTAAGGAMPAFGTVEHDPASAIGRAYALYEGLYGRAPDVLGLEDVGGALRAGAGLTGVATALLASPDYRPAPNPTAFVQSLYANLLHRSADALGLQFYTSELAEGTSQAQVAIQIATSAEGLANVAQAFQAGVFVPDAAACAVARLYYGVLGRAPDVNGLAALEGVARTTGLASVAQAMLSSAEYAASHGPLSDAAYVDGLYVGALGRHADAGAVDYWGAQLTAGAGRAQVAFQIAESQEAHVHLVGQIEQGYALYA